MSDGVVLLYTYVRHLIWRRTINEATTEQLLASSIIGVRTLHIKTSRQLNLVVLGIELARICMYCMIGQSEMPRNRRPTVKKNRTLRHMFSIVEFRHCNYYFRMFLCECCMKHAWCSCCGGNFRIREPNELISFFTYFPILYLYIFDVATERPTRKFPSGRQRGRS